MALNCHLHTPFQQKWGIAACFYHRRHLRSALMTFLCKQEMIFLFSFEMGSFRSTTTINGIPHIHRRIIWYPGVRFFFHFLLLSVPCIWRKASSRLSIIRTLIIRTRAVCNIQCERRDGACETAIVFIQMNRQSVNSKLNVRWWVLALYRQSDDFVCSVCATWHPASTRAALCCWALNISLKLTAWYLIISIN